MLSKEMEKALNRQINEELYSWYLYLAMAAHFEATSMKGMARWMTAQAREEMGHAMKIYGHIFERGGMATLEAIGKPEGKWTSPLKAFEAALKHEQHITGCINDLVSQARKADDYATESFLQWYVDEQVEEEDNATSIVDRLKMAGDQKGALLMIDRELGARGE